VRRWAPWIAGLVGAIAVGLIAASVVGDDTAGDWKHGNTRFIGFAAGLGGAVPFFVLLRLTRGPRVTRDGFTISFKTIGPVAAGYRELGTLLVEDLIAALRAVGYQPKVEACSDEGDRLNVADTRVPLAGTNIAISDPAVPGWIRLQLAPTRDGQARSLGVLEMWSQRIVPVEELALFTLRALDQLVGGVAATRESSKLGEDPVSLLTAGLTERPRYRG
jgi:hypothetical protein